MEYKAKVKIIPKDRAVFWLDRHGRWHNEHGPFEHNKIIAYFNSAIKRDAKGYYLYQKTEYGAEKVYFPYEDCALFAVDLVWDEPITLILNTGKKIPLLLHKLFIKDNDLYMQAGEDRIKFNERCLMRISEKITFENDEYYIKVGDKKYFIASISSPS
jgi:hypothetical protein